MAEGDRGGREEGGVGEGGQRHFEGGLMRLGGRCFFFRGGVAPGELGSAMGERYCKQVLQRIVLPLLALTAD